MEIVRIDLRNSGAVRKIGEKLDLQKSIPVSLYPEFALAVSDTYSCRLLYLCCLEGDQLLGIGSFHEKINLLGENVFSTVPGGFWADDERTERMLLEAASGFLEIRPESLYFKDLHAPLLTLPVRNTAFRAVRRLDVGNLMADYSQNMRRGYKKAVTYHLHIEGTSDTTQFYGVWSRNMRDLGTPPVSINFFKSIRNRFSRRSQVLLVKKDNVTIGGALIIFSRYCAADIYLSSLREHFKFYPNVFLYHEMLSWAKNRGMDIFDLGRSRPRGGNEKFKLRFGAELLPLYSYPAHNKSDMEIRIEKNLTSIWKHIPVGISNRLGPVIRRYIPFG